MVEQSKRGRTNFHRKSPLWRRLEEWNIIRSPAAQLAVELCFRMDGGYGTMARLKSDMANRKVRTGISGSF